MTIDPRLEQYLTKLERVLQPLPVSDRAEIVTEIKSHVLNTLERDPQATLDSVFQALGEPETVANRYLMERGLKPSRPPISPMVKWIMIGIMGSLAMILLFSVFLITRFSPLIHVDDKNSQVSILGGMIKIDGVENDVRIHGFHTSVGHKAANTNAGALPLTPNQSVRVSFSEGEFELRNSSDQQFTWSCSGEEAFEVVPDLDLSSVSIQFPERSDLECELAIPKKTSVSIKGRQGQIEIERPLFSVDAALEHGQIEFSAASGTEYRFNVEVTTGQTSHFPSSNTPNALPINLRVKNGQINFDQ